jgi:A/G-specific adenine glycosylase
MLQQTQVARVVPRYQAFLASYPDPARCAAAPVGDVVRAWQGLGYNRRAVNLHRCAAVVVDRHEGVVPDRLEDLLALPGIGPYTARAVLAFAYERDVAVVDTNVGRVLARLAGRPLARNEVQAAADDAVPAGQGWAWNQGLLDLGATVCTARAPACERCPVSGWCAWGRSGTAGPDPAVGSAGVSGGQSRFEGSDRQGRGRLVDALRTGPVSRRELATVMGWPDDPERAERVAGTLVVDGLARWHRGRLVLP